ncbi:MAG: lysophospholipid acyltransferase family protein [Paracoccaceae bacterium]
MAGGVSGKRDRIGDRLGRWVRQSRTGQWLGATLGALYIRLVLITTRWEVLGRDHYDTAVARGGGLIGATWHGRLCLAPFWAPPRRQVVGMISANRDGDLIAGVLSRFGVTAVRGSSYDHQKRRDKGGAQALTGAEDALAAGNVLVITPDGPRGPRMRAEPGVALLSARTGTPVCPIGFSTERGRVLRSWDRFLIPMPFGRGVQIAGPVLMPPAHAAPELVEAFRLEIEDALTAITAEADRICNRTPVEPAAHAS